MVRQFVCCCVPRLIRSFSSENGVKTFCFHKLVVVVAVCDVPPTRLALRKELGEGCPIDDKTCGVHRVPSQKWLHALVIQPNKAQRSDKTTSMVLFLVFLPPARIEVLS